MNRNLTIKNCQALRHVAEQYRFWDTKLNTIIHQSSTVQN